MVKRILLSLLALILIVIGVKTAVLYLQLDKMNDLTTKGYISTNKGLTLVHEIDNEEVLIQKFHLKVFNKSITTLDLIKNDNWLIALEDMNQYFEIDYEESQLEAGDYLGLYMYWLKHLHFRQGHFALELDQSDIEELILELTGTSLKDALSQMSDKLDYNHFSGWIDFKKDETEIRLSIDHIEIGATYGQGQELDYIKKPIIEFESIEPFLEWFGVLK